MSMTGDDQRSRWVGVGASSLTDAAAAGREATSAALAGPEPALLIVLARTTMDLQALVDSVADTSGDVPLVGCSTAGEIAGSRATGPGVVVIALGGPGFSVCTAACTGAAADLRGTTATAVRTALPPQDRAHRAVMLLTDGLAGDQQQVIRGAYEVVGAAVPLVGGCAGDDLRMVGTHQLHGRQVLTDAVIAVGLASDGPIGIGVSHGWRRVGEPMMVTGAEGNSVTSLDARPALDLYLARLGAPTSLAEDPEEFARFAATHPLGIDRRRGPEARFVAGADLEARSLVCIAEIPEGDLVWLMEGDSSSVLAATDAACERAIEALAGTEPVGLIAFDCIARRGVLGDVGTAEEVRRISERSGGAPVGGFYTYGEFARTSGLTGFHNQTLVVLALG
jgi:hypothetical protein